ncbi:Transcription factor like [Quillaja saponaria]|uniref:Transcription factor like n=1 Tax=Quillaja saponaria TaxID=32244 RepID=A0AAD7QC69_QUISA|nr:Transcription factor like [Quillaja saponaria]
MELPHPQPRSFGSEGRKPIHDFLSLYSHSSAQQDARPHSQEKEHVPVIQQLVASDLALGLMGPVGVGGCPQTHDFLQPLELVGRKTTKEEAMDEISTVHLKPPPPAPPPSVENILPGGIGTYTISHISYFNQRVPKPEGPLFAVAQTSSTDINDENSNCSSYTGSGFTLWEESAVKKGKKGKENIEAEKSMVGESAVRLGQWTSSERLSQSSSNNRHYSFTSRTSSQKQKNQTFTEMITSAKRTCSQEEELDNEEAFVLKNESSTIHKGELRVKVDGKNTDQKANTPRSKHSATEQRRRSKINDRFHMLRELIPHSDQKRDKASFLLEVIEYIHFLQEKVHKFEGSYHDWHHEKEVMPWRNNDRSAENFIDQSQGRNSGSDPALLFATRTDEKNIDISSTIPERGQNRVESDLSTATAFKAIEHRAGITKKAVPLPLSVQPNFLTSVGSGGAVSQLPPRLASDAEYTMSQPQSHLRNINSCATEVTAANDNLKQNELTIEGGTISISNVYSKGLLNTLTQALQSSGVDLSQASISVKIDLGKQANVTPTAPMSNEKNDEVPPSHQGMRRSRVVTMEDSGQALKKLKKGRN